MKIQLKFTKNMLKSLGGIIPGGISIQDFSAITKTNDEESQKILETFLKSGIGSKQEEKYYFEDADKLKTAILFIENGFPLDEIAIALNWRDFEGLTAEILGAKNFAIIKNLILTKPRMEIDVIGIRLGVAMLIDCKHWKRYSTSALSEAVKKQVERTKHYISKTPGAIAVPVIVTLYQDKIDFIDRVPIVPIFQFSSFVDEFYGNLEDMKTIETN
jgi:DNA-binding transcriptional MerR regulator